MNKKNILKVILIVFLLVLSLFLLNKTISNKFILLEDKINNQKQIINKIKKDLENSTGQQSVVYIKKIIKDSNLKINKHFSTIESKIKTLKKENEESSSFINLVAVESKKNNKPIVDNNINKTITKLLLSIKEFKINQEEKIKDLKNDIIFLVKNNKNINKILNENKDIINNNIENTNINSNSLILLKKKKNKEIKMKLKEISEENFNFSGELNSMKKRILNIEKEYNNNFYEKKVSNKHDNEIFFSLYKIINDQKFFIKEKNGEVFDEEISLGDIINDKYKVTNISAENSYIEILNIKTNKKIKVYE